jgi:hypothetical protein
MKQMFETHLHLGLVFRKDCAFGGKCEFHA